MAGKMMTSQRISMRAESALSAIRKAMKGGLGREIVALGLMISVAFLVLSVASYDPADSAEAVWPHNGADGAPANMGGRIGAWLIGVCYTYIGMATHLLIAMLAIHAAMVFFRRKIDGWPLKLAGAALGLFAFAAFFGGSMTGSQSMPTSGGVVGALLFDALSGNFGLTGTYLILTFVTVVSLLMATDVMFYPMLREFLNGGERDIQAELQEEASLAFNGKGDAAILDADGPQAHEPAKPSRGLATRLLAIFARFDAEEKSRKKAAKAEAKAVALAESEGGVAVADPEVRPIKKQKLKDEVVSGPEGDDDDQQDDQDEEAQAGADNKQAAPLERTTPKNNAAAKRAAREKAAALKKQQAEAAKQFAANYTLPSNDILEHGRKVEGSKVKGEITTNASEIVNTLSHFKIEAEVIDVQRGPTITTYELKTPPNVQVKKIVSLETQLLMMLRAPQLRIQAPIPGRNTVGIEVPNRDRDTVSLREVVESDAFRAAEKKMQLPIALGLDSMGEPMIRDLAKAPHLLIAGTTGSGKSVIQNVILTSLLLTRHYDDVRLMLVDPKSVELTPYEDLRHLITPVITDMSKAVTAFEWLVEEMERRYDMFAKTRTRKISEFNELEYAERCKRFEAKGGNPADLPRKMPCIVAMVDELADMMMVNADTRVDELICRIAQKARAAGIHLILATQRPSADVVTGLIKANVPARIGFKLPTAVDSRTIIAALGCEKLLGMGDMLVDWNDGKGLMRAQSAFSDTPEIESICGHVREQAPVDYLVTEKKLERASSDDNMIGGQPKHEKLDEAIDMVLSQGRASAQFLRSALRIGYNAATTIVMQMEMLGILGPARGSKEREILMTAEEWKGLQEAEARMEDMEDMDDEVQITDSEVVYDSDVSVYDA